MDIEKKKKKTPILAIVAVTLLVSSLIYIIKDIPGFLRPFLYAAKIFYAVVMSTSGDDLVAMYLVVIVFSVGAVAGIGLLIPRVKFSDEKRTKIAFWSLHLIRLGIALVPVAAAAVVVLKLSPWFVFPVLLLALSGSLYLIGKYWLLKLRKLKREGD